MRRIPAFTLLVILTSGCGGSGDEASSTTTTLVTTTTTTTLVTTTSEATTTTSEATTTTTVPGQAVVVTAEGVLGIWTGSMWQNSVTVGEVPAGGNYQVLDIGGPSSVSIGGTPVDDQCMPVPDQVYVDLAPNPWPWDSVFNANKVAVLAPWNVAPRPIEHFGANDAYRAIASDLLATRGVVDAAPQFVQLMRVDLEGDGVTEVLAVIERFTGAGEEIYSAPAGDYSIAFVRKMVDGEVQTAILGEYVVVAQPEGWIQDLVLTRIDGLADIDQDGVDEIVVHTVYYEGSSAEVYDWQGPDLGFVSVIGQGCGS